MVVIGDTGSGDGTPTTVATNNKIASWYVIDADGALTDISFWARGNTADRYVAAAFYRYAPGSELVFTAGSVLVLSGNSAGGIFQYQIPISPAQSISAGSYAFAIKPNGGILLGNYSDTNKSASDSDVDFNTWDTSWVGGSNDFTIDSRYAISANYNATVNSSISDSFNINENISNNYYKNIVPSGQFETLRIIASGPNFGIPFAYSGASSDWQSINENIPNGDTNYIYTTNEEAFSSFTLGSSRIPSGVVISSITVRAYAKAGSPNNNPMYVDLGVYMPNGSYSLVPIDGSLSPSLYTLREYDFTTRPSDGAAWQTTDLSGLNVMVAFPFARGINGDELRVTQVWADVNYTGHHITILDGGIVNGFNPRPSDNFTITDTSLVKAIQTLLLDSYNIADDLVRIVEYTRSISDTKTINESIVVNLEKTFGDLISISDIIQQRYGINPLDVITLSDIYKKDVGTSLTDLFNTSDGLITTNEYIRTNNDSLSMQDNVSNSFGFNLIEIISLVDELLYIFETSLNLSDTLTLSEILSLETIYEKNDTITLTDIFENTSVFNRAFNDSIITSETISKAITRSESDTITLSDVFETGMVLTKDDTINILDAISKNYGINNNDNLSVNEILQRLVEYNRSPEDTLIIGDFLLSGEATNWYLSSGDLVIITDSLNRTATYNIIALDSLNISELLSNNYNITATDIETIQDALSTQSESSINESVTILDNILKEYGINPSDVISYTEDVYIGGTFIPEVISRLTLLLSRNSLIIKR